MRRIVRALVVLGLAVAGIALPVSAGAGTLSVSGSSLSMEIAGLPSVPIAQNPEPLSGVVVSSGAGSFSLSPGLFATTRTLTSQLFTGVPLASSLRVTASNGTGAFSGGTGFGGTMPLAGQAVLGLLGGLINLSIPLSVVGAGGVVQNAAAALAITVTGANWGTGVAQVTGITTTTPNGVIANTLTLSGYDNRTTGHRGTLQLVTPIRILTNVAGGLPAFSVLTLNFVPEPGMLLLLGASGLVLLGVGSRRRPR